MLKRLFWLRGTAIMAAFGLGLCLTGQALADDQPPRTLQDVLRRYVQAVSPARGRAEVKSRRTTGTSDYGGLHGTFVAISKAPDKNWEEDKLGILDESSGTDGKVSWQRDGNGNVRLLSAEEQKTSITDAGVSSFGLALVNRFPGTVTLRPKTERRTGCYVLDVEPKGGRLTTLFLDPKTYLIVKQERLDDTRLTTITYDNFRLLGGTMQAGTVRVHEGNNKFDRVVTITGVDDNVEAPDTLFALPATEGNYRWTTPGATSATLPFDYSDKSIALYCAINGRPTYLELDSGAGGVAISDIAARDLNLQSAGTLEGRGYGGSVDTSLVKIDTFEIVDGVVFSNLTATTLPLFGVHLFLQSIPNIGLVGYDLLSRFVVRINYATQEITLIDPKTFQPTPADGTPLTLDLNENAPSVLASFDGLPPARFLVDTGDAGSTVMLYGPYVADNHIAQKYPHGIKGGATGIGGAIETRNVRAQSFSIAGVLLKDVPTQLSLDTKGAGGSHVLAGALGTDLLSHFTVTFDYPHSRVFFAPNADTQKPFDTRTFDITVVQGRGFLTMLPRMIVIAGPKAPERDAKKLNGATLLQIDGQDAITLGLGEVRRLLSVRGGKDTHDLLVSDDKGHQTHVIVGMYDPMPPLGPK